MTVCICGESAWAFWTRLRVQAAGRLRVEALCTSEAVTPRSLGFREARVQPDSFEVPGAHELEQLSRELFPGVAPGQPLLPIHIATTRDGRRRSTPGCRCRVLSAVLPGGSFYRLSSRVAMASPELAFLQAAEGAPLIGLVKMGFEACGAYAADARAALPTLPGAPGRRGPGFSPCVPIATRVSLARYLDRVQGRVRGIVAARRAAGLVLDRSASPMETAQAVLLCFPRRMGGYGLRRPELNCRIDIPESLRGMAGRDFLVCDAYWPDARLDVEYDSNAHHLDASSAARDAGRRGALRLMGVSAMSVTTRQLFDVDLFDRAARQIARSTGVRLRDRFEYDWVSMRGELRKAMLLGGAGLR